jgi:prefoldin beta subunit
MQDKSIEEMHILEQGLQNILLQKQAFQMELSETDSALKEIDSSGDEVFKIIGQIMLKTKKETINEDLLNKRKILDLRLKNLEKQEDSLSNQIDSLREKILEEKQ